MDQDNLVTRKEQQDIEKVIKQPGFSVVALHGPGGTGKTSLIRMLRTKLTDGGQLPLYIKGTKKEVDNHIIVKLTDIFTLELFGAVKRAGLSESDMPALKKAVKELDKFDDYMHEKFREETGEDPRNVVKLCDYVSLRIADLIYMSRTDSLVSSINIDDRVRASIESLMNRLIRKDNYSGIANLSQRWNILADAITKDLKRLLQSRQHFLGKKKYNGAVLILDNYEYMSKFVRIFLEQHLIPFFEGANINLTLLLVSRDSITDFPEASVKHFALGPFSNEEATNFLKAHGIGDPKRRSAIVRNTMRYPYLMDYEVKASSQSARALQQYFDRITRWMTSQQKDWLIALSYLKYVDKAEIRKVIKPGETDAVMQWFKNEPSVRCAETGRWKIIPLISQKIHAYVKVEDPERDEHLRFLASAAGPIPSQHTGNPELQPTHYTNRV